MRFDGRLVAELTSDDIQALFADVVEEDESIDYKSQPYGGQTPDSKSRVELCCDIVAFANNGLGYIIIGIAEADKKPVKLCTIGNPAPYIESIRKTSMDGIEPPVIGLEVGAIQMPNREYVIVIRIPPSEFTPHMVKLHHSTHFCRRYGDDKREMTYSQIKGLFIDDANALRLAQMDAKLDMLIEQGAPSPAPPAPTENANTTADPNRIREIMELRMREIADQ